MKSASAVALATLLSLLTASGAAAIPFSCLSNNSATDCLTATSQITVDVVSVDASHVRFDFANVGAGASSITAVYFDDGLLSSVGFSLVESAGVDFGLGANPANLPAGNTASPPFVATIGFDSESPTQPNGVNPGETLGILLSLTGANDFEDVQNALLDGALRIGLHIQGFTGGGSESLINLPVLGQEPEPVPAPMGVVLLGVGLLALRVATRARRR